MHGNWEANIRNTDFVCSWSGGKDSCLALYRASRVGRPVQLFTMLDESGTRSRSHGLPPALLRAQAAALGLPLATGAATWENYEAEFIAALRRFEAADVRAAVFGDIDLEEHGAWERQVCAAAGLQACLPLWRNDRRELVTEFLDLGFRAVIVAVQEVKLSPRYLGRELTPELLAELEAEGVDLCGENGEFHTAVLDGPLFRQPVRLQRGEVRSQQGYSFLAVRPEA